LANSHSDISSEKASRSITAARLRKPDDASLPFPRQDRRRGVAAIRRARDAAFA
jgi:hypothetical protein